MSQSLCGAKAAKQAIIAILILTIGTIALPIRADILVSETGTGRILRYGEGSGAFLGVFASGLILPEGLSYGPDGKVYVPEYSQSSNLNNNIPGRVSRFLPDGTPDGVFCVTPGFAEQILFDRAGNVFVEAGNKLYRYDMDGNNLGAIAQGFGNTPVAIGPDGYLYWYVSGPNGVSKFLPDGSNMTFLFSGSESGLAFDTSGTLFVDEGQGDGIMRWDGHTLTPFCALTEVHEPDALVLDSNGDLILCTGREGTLYRIHPNGAREAMDAGLSYPQWAAVTPTSTANRAPVANAGPDADTTVNHDGDPNTNTATFLLDGSASSDPDSDSLSYEWSLAGNVVGTSAQLQQSQTAGSYTYTLKVTDVHGASSTDDVTITVHPEPNAPPSLSVPYSVLGVAGQPITFSAHATDPDGDPITYSLIAAPAGMTINSSTGAVSWTPPQSVSGTFTLQVKAVDPYGASDIQTVTVTVNPIKTAVFHLNQNNLVLSRNGSSVTATFSIDNASTGTALDVAVSGAYLQNKTTYVKYNANAPLPGPYTIPGGGSQSMALTFTGVPAGINATLQVTVTYDGGSVTFSRVVTVP